MKLKFFQKCIKYVEKNIPEAVPYLLMIQRHSTRMVCDWSEDELIRGVMHCYRRHMGYEFDINNPVTFTEKLQWYKCFYQRPDMADITDKYLFKQYIQDRLGSRYTIPVFGAWTSVEALERDWSSLPEEFALKANLQSDGRNILIIRKKSDICFRTLRRHLKSWLDKRNTLANSFDCKVYCGTPRILAEKYMANFEEQLYDYKFFCFDGKIFCIYVAQDHFGKDGSHISFYDINWKKLNVQYGSHKVGDAPCPKHFSEMVKIAEKLSIGFPFIRVDFFDTDEQLYVAELTFNPGGGVTPYHPESFNRQLGEKFVLPR